LCAWRSQLLLLAALWFLVDGCKPSWADLNDRHVWGTFCISSFLFHHESCLWGIRRSDPRPRRPVGDENQTKTNPSSQHIQSRGSDSFLFHALI
jgi:hypothetical protein